MKRFSALQRVFAKLLVVFLCFSGVLTVSGAAGDVDPSFNASAYGSGSGTVNIIKKQPDGKYLIGGSFWDVNGVAAGGLARLNADLTVDTSFNPADFGNGFGFGGAVFAIGLQSTGKIVVAGDIWGANNVFKPGVKRLNPDGTLDNTFQPPDVPQNTVYYDLVVLPDDKIIVGNQRLNADGTLDNSFTTLTIGSKEVEVLPDGKILSAGASIARFNSNGTPDNSFAVAGTDGIIEAIVPLADGKILIGGTFMNVNGFQSGRIARLNMDGTLDLTFNQNMLGANSWVNDIALRADGKIVIVGAFATYNNVARTRVAQLNADGTLDTSFVNPNIGTALEAKDVEILPDGKLLVGFVGGTLPALMRFNTDGTLDNTFNAVIGNGTSRVRRITQQADEKILFVGKFNYVNGVQRRSAARLNLDGTLDTSFVPYFTLTFDLTSVAVQSDGKVVVGSLQGPVVARLNADGSRDTGFTAAVQSSSAVYDVAALPDGKVLAAGDITSSGPNSLTRRIVRFNTDGTIDTSFALNQPNATVYKVLVQPDGKILIGGAFTQIGASLRGRIARLNADGTLDETFNPPGGANGDVYNLDLQSDGKVVLGGVFNGLNGVLNRNRVGRLNADGSLDASFVQPLGINSSVVGLTVQADNKVIVTGNFNTIGGAAKLGIARFNADGSLDTAFNPYINNALPSTSGALDAYLQTDGKILIGGEFTKMNGVSHVRIARLLNNIAPPRTPFDFDGDGKADISVFRPSENKWYILQSSNASVREQVFAVAGDVPVPSDFDGDGKTDVAVFRPSSGDWWYLSSASGAQVNVHWGASGDIPRPSDFDGDGKTDFVVYRPSNSAWYRLGSTGATSITAFGIAEDKPLIGDFDGDGKSDLAVFRPSTGDWWYASSLTGQFISVHWGASGDIPVPGDYDGDSKTDFVVFRPSDGGWYILYSTGSYTIATFGTVGDKPVAADYDGDGKTDIAVWRPSTGTWYLLQTTAGFGAVNWGTAGDIPTENAFLP